MANQYTTVQRINDFIGEENFIANVAYYRDENGGYFRMVCRWRDGADRLTQLEYCGCSRNHLVQTVYIGVENFNKPGRGSFQCSRTELFEDSVYGISALDFMKKVLSTYARRYTRPAYFNADGTTKCKYTQEQLDRKDF